MSNFSRYSNQQQTTPKEIPECAMFKCNAGIYCVNEWKLGLNNLLFQTLRRKQSVVTHTSLRFCKSSSNLSLALFATILFLSASYWRCVLSMLMLKLRATFTNAVISFMASLKNKAQHFFILFYSWQSKWTSFTDLTSKKSNTIRVREKKISFKLKFLKLEIDTISNPLYNKFTVYNLTIKLGSIVCFLPFV